MSELRAKGFDHIDKCLFFFKIVIKPFRSTDCRSFLRRLRTVVKRLSIFFSLKLTRQFSLRYYLEDSPFKSKC